MSSQTPLRIELERGCVCSGFALIMMMMMNKSDSSKPSGALQCKQEEHQVHVAWCEGVSTQLASTLGNKCYTGGGRLVRLFYNNSH